MTDNKGPEKYWEFYDTHTRWYILKHRKPVPCYDMCKVNKGLNFRNKRVRRTYLPNNVFVSTVFLGLDHRYGSGPPLLFETMIHADGEFIEYQTRCSTWRQALKMHWAAVEIAKDD